MPAQGWEILSQRSVPSPMTGDGARLRSLDLRLGNERMLVYYWFQCGRRQTDHDLVARWYRFLDFIANSLDPAEEAKLQPTMIATIYVPYTGTVEDARARATEFMQGVGPSLLRAIDSMEN
jgi:EpsI family protein